MELSFGVTDVHDFTSDICKLENDVNTLSSENKELKENLEKRTSDIRKLENDVNTLSSENKELKENLEKRSRVLELQNELLHLTMDKNKGYYTILLVCIAVLLTDIVIFKAIFIVIQIIIIVIMFYLYSRIDKCEKKIKELKDELRR